MNVYEQIETIFSGDAEKKPEWANEILKELADIKTLLVKKELPHQRVNNLYSNDDYYDFIKQFRISLTDKIFEYKGRNFSVNKRGLLYDTKTLKIVSKSEAFKIYKYAYEQKESSKISA